MRTKRAFRFMGRLKRAISSWNDYDPDFHNAGRITIFIRSFRDTPTCYCPEDCQVHHNKLMTKKQLRKFVLDFKCKECSEFVCHDGIEHDKQMVDELYKRLNLEET